MRGGGDFFCPQCYQSRRFRFQVVYQYATIMMWPLWRIGPPEKSVVCQTCGAVFSDAILEYEPDAADRQFFAEVLRVNVLMAMVEGRLEPAEIAAIQRLYQQLTGQRLTRTEIEDEVRQACEDDVDAAGMVRRIGRSLGGEGARIVAQQAFQVAAATGHVSPNRQAQLDQFPAGLGISPADFQRLVEDLPPVTDERHGGLTEAGLQQSAPATGTPPECTSENQEQES